MKEGIIVIIFHTRMLFLKPHESFETFSNLQIFLYHINYCHINAQMWHVSLDIIHLKFNTHKLSKPVLLQLRGFIFK